MEHGEPGQEPIFVDQAVFVIGKSTLGFLASNPFVSRHHAEIRYEAGNYLISDLDSTNGAFLNGVLLEPNTTHLLAGGDLIGLADKEVELRFHDGKSTIPRRTAPSLDNSEIEVDPGLRQVWVRHKRVDFSRKQYDVFSLLYKRRGNVVGKDEIAERGWPEREHGDVSDADIEQCVRRVRYKIELDPSNPEIIVTHRGYGYAMR